MSTAPERKPPYPIGAGIRALSVARDEEHSAPGACIGQGRAGDGTRLRRAMCGCLAQHAARAAVRHMPFVAAVTNGTWHHGSDEASERPDLQNGRTQQGLSSVARAVSSSQCGQVRPVRQRCCTCWRQRWLIDSAHASGSSG